MEDILLKKLVIAEKPKAARALVNGLYKENFNFIEPKKKFKPPSAKAGYYESDNVIVVYAQGHILRLKTVEEYLGLPASPRNYDCLPYIPQTFELTVADKEWYQVQFGIIKELLKRKDINEIVHFGDPDNEGELIVRELLSYCGNKLPVKRLWCNSMVPETIANAYYNLQDDKLYNDKYLQALARQQFDFLWGINISRLLTKAGKDNYPAGRVLVPIVKYVYDRDEEIENFTSTKSYGMDATVKKGDWSYKVSNSKPGISYPENEKGTVEQIKKVLCNSDKVVTKYETKIKTLKAKHLFNLSTFQSAFFKKYGYSLDEGLSTIQKLYEKGFVTYPRTSVEYLSQKEANEVEKIVTMLAASGQNVSFSLKSSIFDDSKCVGGHTALIITKMIPTSDDYNSMSEAEQLAYSLIFNRFMSNFASPAKVNETTLEITVGDYLFSVTGNELVEEGFLIYEDRKLKDKIPEFAVGEVVDVDFDIAERESTPPPKVTPASILDFLKNPYANELKTLDKNNDAEYYKLLKEGATLGTESTTATIVKNAQTYGYIKQKGKSFSITDKGIVLIKLLDAFGINLYKEKNIEMNKTIVAIGNKAATLNDSKEKTRDELQEIFQHNLNLNITIDTQMNNGIGKCPKCGNDVVERNKAFCCTNNDCDFYIYKEDKYFAAFGKKITPTIAKSLLKKGQVQLNKLKSKNGKEYSIIIKVDYNGKYPRYSTEFPVKKTKK